MNDESGSISFDNSPSSAARGCCNFAAADRIAETFADLFLVSKHRCYIAYIVLGRIRRVAEMSPIAIHARD